MASVGRQTNLSRSACMRPFHLLRQFTLLLIPFSALTLIGLAQGSDTLRWRDLPALPQPSGGHMVGQSNGTLLAIGGSHFNNPPWEGGQKIWLDTILALKPGADEWSQVGRLPHPLGYGAAVTIDDGLILLGGSDGRRHYAEVKRLRFVGDRLEITELPPLPAPNANFGATLVGRTIYVAGGQSDPLARIAQTALWSFEPDNPWTGWKIHSPVPASGRILPVAVGQNGALHLISGAELVVGPTGLVGRQYLSEHWRYNPNGGWVRLADAPRPVVAATGLAIGQSHLLLFGGDDGRLVVQAPELRERHPGFSREVLSFNTITDTWSIRGEMPVSLVTTGATLWQGEIIIVGGEDRPAHRSGRTIAASLRMNSSGFGWLDYLVLGIYLAATMLVGLYVSRGNETSEDFFLGGRRIPWWAAGLSIYGTQLSAVTYLAVPAKTYAEDWTYLLSTICIVLVAPLIIRYYLPFFRGLNITTAYEYLEYRFNLAVRLFGSSSFIIFQASRLAIVLFLPALALSAAGGFNIYLCILLMGVLTTLYTMKGGLQAVIWTDVVQVFVLLGGAVAALVVLINGTKGGINEIISTGFAAGKFHLLNLSWDATTTTVWVMIVGNLATHLIPYTTDQSVVQKYLTTRNEREAARGIAINAALTIPTALIFFSVGTALFVFYKIHPERLNPGLQTDATFAWFIANNLPGGVAGLVLAGVFAAAMSTLSSSINSIATAIVTDFYVRLRPAPSETSSLKLARWLTLLFGFIGTTVAMLMAGFEIRSLWDLFLQSIGLTGSGLAGIFILGIFTRRANSAGVLIGALASGVVLILLPRYTSLHFFLHAAAGIATCVTIGYLASRLLPGAGPIPTAKTFPPASAIE
jgi:solute:Na+ symporter, SSS family